jgi:sulfate adenylyltransferase
MDAEQIAVGAFSPIEGFMCQNEMNSVLDNMRLPSGIVWPIPIILQLSTENAKKFSIGEKILLVYEEDNLAYCTLVIEDIYKLDKEEIIKKWFGTDNPEHPGVKQIILGGDYAIGGKIELIRKRESPYKLYELAPEQTRRIFSERGWKKVVGFHTRNAIHCSHEFIQMDAMRKGFCDGLFVHPVIGKKKEGDFEPNIIIKSYEKMVNGIYPKGKVVFSAFPTFSRYAGPREAIFTALTRKNFGCSHFIVGRDHTGVGNFYSPTASHEIFDKFSKEELGIIPIKFNKVFYSSTEKNHFHESECPNYPEDKKLHISGTEARKILQEGKMPPEWFMRPEISSLILETLKNKEKVFVGECNSKVIWFTGLSGSGKTTIALELKKRLENLGKKVIILDGDNIRSSLHKHLGFSREDIRENNRLIAEMCKGQKNADFILVPIISPYKQDRESARTLIGKHNFIELFISTPIEECIKRDVKGLYKKAFSGEISNFIGVHGSNPYEPPENPDMKINTLGKTAEECTELIIKFLMAKNFNS